jgi:hypothetical protein
MDMGTREVSIIAHYEAIGRERALTDQESAELERAVRQRMRREGRVYFVWLPKHNLAIRRALRRPRPGIVAQLAERFGINERAVWRQITRLRKAGQVGYISPPGSTGRYPRQGSKAIQGQCEA